MSEAWGVDGEGGEEPEELEVELTDEEAAEEAELASVPSPMPPVDAGPLCARCGSIHMRWTGVEWRATCKGHRRQLGDPCKMWRVPGFDVCRKHGAGGAKFRAQGQQRLKLERTLLEMERLGGSIDVSPTEAMLTMVRESAWNVAYLRMLIDGLKGGVEDAAEAPVVIDSEGVAQVHPAWVGAKVAVRTDPDNWVAAPHVLVRMYNEERDRLVKYAKLCRDAGVEERMVTVAEEQGRWLVRTVDLVLERLGLTEAQQAALPTIMTGVLRELGSG